MRAQRDRRTRARQREMVAVERAEPEVIELPVVEFHEPLAPGVLLPDPFGKPIFDFLLLVASGLRSRHIDGGFALVVIVENRRGAQIERVLDQGMARCARCAPFAAVGDPRLDGGVHFDRPQSDLCRVMHAHVVGTMPV